MKVIVFGIDGGSWDFVRPWIDGGELPGLAEIQQQGTWSVLKSCLPPVTAPNWKCYSTGRNPGKLGVYWWQWVDFQARTFQSPTADSYSGQELWDYLGHHGFRSVVINMPTTYPPKPLRGVIVTGGPDALEQGFTFPSRLEQRLKAEYRYRILPARVDYLKRRDSKSIQECYELIRTRFVVAQALAEEEKPDFLQVTIYLINVLQHFFGRDPIVLEAWKIIDRSIGELRKKYPEALCVLVSDHGTNEIVFQFNINVWLRKQGYLVTNHFHPVTSLLVRMGINKETVARGLTRLGLRDTVKRKLPESLRNALPTGSGSMDKAGKSRLIDWDSSAAIGLAQGGVYLNPRLAPEERKDLELELVAKLEQIVHREIGIPVTKKVYRARELYGDKLLGMPPDLMVQQNERVHISGRLEGEQVFTEPEAAGWINENVFEGMFAIVGPGVKCGRMEMDPTITDVAPTILHIMGCPVDEDMDGRVLKEVFVSASPHLHSPVNYHVSESSQLSMSEAEAEEGQVEERLRSLGYIE